MQQHVSARAGFRRSQWVIAISMAMMGSSAALAADSISKDGVMQFPNVRVVDAANPGAPMSVSQGGMKAYKDSADSALRGPSLEEMQADAAASSATTSAATSRSPAAARRTAASQVAAPSPVSGVGATLDESSLQYSVVVRQPDGSLAEVCVTGVDAARDLVMNHSMLLQGKAPKEILNDR